MYVTFENFGKQCRWIIECKLWSGRVKKSAVQTLHSIVQNIGADRGVIFCENGFQSGARTAAQGTNVLLQDSLEDFRLTAQLHMSRIPLNLQDSDEPDAPPVHILPDGYQPNHLLKHDELLFVSNWGATQKGNVAIINPTARSIEGLIELDKYEELRPSDGGRTSATISTRQH